MFGRLVEVFDRRFGFREDFKRNVLDHPVPPRINLTYCFGGITFLLYMLLAATGITMLFFYVPSVDHAFVTVEYITFDLPLGNPIRAIHHWSAQLMIVFVSLHMLRVFVYGAYKNPREFNWVTGVFLFGITLAFGFTGYLLPWDQKAYWATKVGVLMPKSLPAVGPFLSQLLMGGDDLGALTLSRFFAIHVAVLPIFTVIFLAGHF
ncbi:MAG: cytochrome b N-terminal domain-containing protein [Nitrospirae bacterium]|nr:cytochrome b N-terminal domain-containing protein [Nitrospirota bacterium]MCL5977423.1 cytochrome b N-terminal domain-containing protein [Nitrospirota bacterium]